MANSLLTDEQRSKIEFEVNDILVKHSCDFDQWGVIRRIAKDEGIQLQEAALQDISGILFKDKRDHWTIIVNAEDSITRKLFTVAHELGHYFLHRNDQDKFIDSQFIQSCYGRTEDTKFQQKELEANEFAGNLIMPKSLIDSELHEIKSEKVDEVQVLELAQKFNVSPLAMETRLRNLEYNV